MSVEYVVAKGLLIFGIVKCFVDSHMRVLCVCVFWYVSILDPLPTDSLSVFGHPILWLWNS